MLCLVAWWCLTLCDPMNCSPPGSSVHRDSPGKNTGVGCHAFLQGIFPTQGSNPGLLRRRQILYRLSFQESHIDNYYITIYLFSFLLYLKNLCPISLCIEELYHFSTYILLYSCDYIRLCLMYRAVCLCLENRKLILL